MSRSHAEQAVCSGQLYLFLAGAFLYPREDWTRDWAVLVQLAQESGIRAPALPPWGDSLETLQGYHYRAFGVTGSLCYETEYGLPHEFRHSQELADLAGFYAAFGFSTGGAVRERPDHLAVELEFMGILRFKEAYALERGTPEQVEVCIEAQRKFLQDHLGRWIDLYRAAFALNASEGPYVPLTQVLVDFVHAEIARLNVTIEPPQYASLKPTPLGPELSCEDCPVAELGAG